jgi:hypothetical protein
MSSGSELVVLDTRIVIKTWSFKHCTLWFSFKWTFSVFMITYTINLTPLIGKLQIVHFSCLDFTGSSVDVNERHQLERCHIWRSSEACRFLSISIDTAKFHGSLVITADISSQTSCNRCFICWNPRFVSRPQSICPCVLTIATSIP